jgi:hypothetical protein
MKTPLRALFGTLMVLFTLMLVLAPAVSAKENDKDKDHDKDRDRGAQTMVAEVASLSIMASNTPGWFDVSASAYPHDMTLHVRAIGPGQAAVTLPDVMTNGAGATTFNFQMPRYEPAGQWTLLVTDKNGDSASATFALPYLGPNVGLIVSPASGPAGASFTVTSTGFRDDEAVHYWLTGPDGTIYAADTIAAFERTTGKSERQGDEHNLRHGLIEFAVAIGPDMPRGQYAVSVYGTHSDSLGIATFTVD